MFRFFCILLTFNLAYVCGNEFSSHVLGGTDADINHYPHAVILAIHSKIKCMCGGSILTTHLVLTAAHCFDDYLERKVDVTIVKYGASALAQMSQTPMSFYINHDDYDEFSLFSDISLVRLHVKLTLGNSVKRVAIMESPPADQRASVCGWGVVDYQQGLPNSLKHTHQQIQTVGTCRQHLKFPPGTFCAGNLKGNSYPASGDSGGALMVQEYIQIGIVSFKENGTSLVAYTNISYFYKWIADNAVTAICSKVTRPT